MDRGPLITHRSAHRAPGTGAAKTRRIGGILLIACACAIALLSAPASAAAAEPTVITSPAGGSSTTGAIKFAGTADPAGGAVTLAVHEGASAGGTVVEELEAPVSEETGAWATLPSLLGEGTYTAVAEQPGAAGRSEAVTFTVDAAPKVLSNPSPATVLAGEDATFQATASGTPAPEVQWQVSTDGGGSWSNDNLDAGASSGELTVAKAALAQDGNEYRAVFTNSSGSATSLAATLHVHTPPSITLQPEGATVLLGDAVHLKAAASGNPAPQAQWQVSSDSGAHWSNDLTDAGNTSATLTVLPTLAQSGYEYRAVFTNVAGEATSEAATIEVMTKPAVTSNPASVGVTAGQSAHFTAAASGQPAPSVQWQISTDFGAHWSNDLADSGNASETLTVAATLAKNGYEYRAVFTNAAGSATTLPATLTVSEATVAPEVTTQPTDASALEGETAEFTATASGTPAPSVKWEVSTNGGGSWSADKGDAGATSETLEVAATLAKNGYEYRARFSNKAGEALSGAARLTVAAKPAAPAITTQPLSATVTAGSPAGFTAAASGVPTPSVQWQVSTNGGVSWSADTADAGNTSGTLTIAAAAFGQSGNLYRAVFSNGVGSPAVSAPAMLTVDTVPVVTSQPAAVTVLEGSIAEFTAEASGSPIPTVKWEVLAPGGSWTVDKADLGATSGTLGVASTAGKNGYEYRARFGNRAGEAVSAPAKLTVAKAPAITTQPVSAIVTAGSPASFTAAAGGAPAPTVQWQVSTDAGAHWSDDVADAGSTTGTLTIAAAAFSENGNEYRAVFSNGWGEAATSKPATLTVDTVPVVTADPASLVRLEGETAVFTVEATGSPTPHVQWEVSTNKGATWATDAGSTTPTLTIAKVVLAQSGSEYRARVANRAGEAVSKPALLTVSEDPLAPEVTTQPADVTINAGQPASFTAAARGIPTPSVQWRVSTDGGATWSDDTVDHGNTTGTLTIAAAEAGANGNEYVAVFTSAAGTAESKPARLTVDTPPVVTVSPLGAAVTEGQPAAFTAAAAGRPAPAISWQVSTDGGRTWSADTVDEGTTSNTLMIAAAAAAQNGYEYRAAFANPAGEATSGAAILSVSPRPAAPTPPGPPVAAFTWFPAHPHTGETVTLVSTSTDAFGAITSFAWDLAGSGTPLAGPSAVTTSFATPGAHPVSLRVGDSNGLGATVTQAIPVSAPRIGLMQPFPVVRIAGSDTAAGARLTLITVQAPAGATVSIICSGRGCPRHGETRVVPAGPGAGGGALLTFARFERRLRAGAVLWIRVTHAGQVGKYTRFTIRRGRLPVRVDACLGPSSPVPIACPT